MMRFYPTIFSMSMSFSCLVTLSGSKFLHTKLFSVDQNNEINKNISKDQIIYEVVIGSHTDCISQQLVVILTTSNNLIGSQYDYQLNYYL